MRNFTTWLIFSPIGILSKQKPFDTRLCMPHCSPSRKYLFACKKCHHEYLDQEEATNCSECCVEPIIFNIDDPVRLLIPHRCKTILKKPKKLSLKGVVIAIKGPLPPQIESEIRGQKSPRTESHVFLYTVHAHCKRCEKCLEFDWFLPDMVSSHLH